MLPISPRRIAVSLTLIDPEVYDGASLDGEPEIVIDEATPTDWDEECKLDGNVDMGPHLDDPDDPRVDAAITERKPKRRSRRRR